MGKKKITLLFCLILLGTLLCVSLFPKNVSAGSEAFDIEKYIVNIEVDKDGVYHVSETLNVHFNEKRHGIYLNIPTTYSDYHWEVDGETIEKDYYFPVNKVTVTSGQNYSVDTSSEGVQVQIGSGDYYANEYEKYVVTYDVHTTDLGLNGQQSFYYNIVSTTWNADIYHVEFNVTFPTDISEYKPYFYTYQDEMDPELKYEVNGNSISGTYDKMFSYGNGITLKMDLPNNYFTFPSARGILPFAIGGGILILGLGFILFTRYGKDDPVIETVEFTAPKGLTSADVGYIIDDSVDNRDVVSLIIDWANKGYLKIEDLKDDLKFIKLKDPDNTVMHPYEITLFKAIFKNKTEVTTNYLSEKFYTPLENCKGGITRYFDNKDRKIFSTKSTSIQIIMSILSAVPVLLFSGSVVYYSTFNPMIVLFVSIITVVAICLGNALIANVVKTFKTKNKASALGFIVLGFICNFVAYGLALCITAYYDTSLFLFCFIFIALSIAISIVSVFMSKRTTYGTEMYGKVIGLKNFILYAEKDRLDMLCKDDPTYFYHILPYAYALGLSNIWSEHFKDMEIAPPDWYSGRDVFYFDSFNRRLTSNMSVVQHPIPPVTRSSGGGGGFGGGGGGFSGGGFSGGGFGGSSGGSW